MRKCSLVRSLTALIKDVSISPKCASFIFLYTRGHTYTSGGYWTKKFMAWINRIELNQTNDEHVLRGHLADIAYVQSRIQEAEEQTKSASSMSKFCRNFGGLDGLPQCS